MTISKTIELTERENALRVFRGEDPLWVPTTWESCFFCDEGIAAECGPTDERGMRNGGMDLWGVNWVLSDLGEGKPTPDPLQKPLLEDIEDWRDVVTFPDMSARDWEGAAKKQAEKYDGSKLLCYFDTNGLFNRMTQLMGHENALCALMEDPDECKDFVHAIADVKISIVRNASKHLHPDLFCYMDDMCSGLSPMISPETYREVFKEEHRRIIQAIKDEGMIAEQHMCGNFNLIMEDLVEIGIEAFLPAQPRNDLDRLRELNPDVVIHGGAEAQSATFAPDAPPEGGIEEARRVIEEYAPSKRYFVYISTAMATPAHQAFFKEVSRLGHLCYQRRKDCAA